MRIENGKKEVKERREEEIEEIREDGPTNIEKLSDQKLGSNENEKSKASKMYSSFYGEFLSD